MVKLANINKQIFDDLDKGLMILTPNHRTNVQLIESYGLYRRQQSLNPVCLSPEIFPIDIWVRDTFNNEVNNFSKNQNTVSILESFQELYLWKNIIRESKSGASLLNIEGTASTVIEAYRIIQQWEIPEDEIEDFLSKAFTATTPPDDLDVFLEWYKAYEQRCQPDNLVNLSKVLALFIDAINNGLVPLPEKVILLGFDNPPPLYQRLFNTLEQKHCEITHLNYDKFTPSFEKRELNNQTQEMLAAAQWSKTILEQDQKAKIAIICPDLHTRQQEINRTFSNTFYPDNALGAIPPQSSCFSTTASEDLNAQALVQFALMILKLNRDKLPSLEIFQLIRSPFIIAANEEADARAALELRLRKIGEMNCQLSNLRYLASQEGKPWCCPILSNSLAEIEKIHKLSKGIKNINEWSLVIEQQLEKIITPTLFQDNKVKLKQFTEQWYELLTKLKNLSSLCGHLSFNKAIDLLNQLARNTKSSTFFNQAPIQILAPVEASGIQFTHLWFLGLSEANWPPPTRSNPFIPIKLQIKYKIPAANVESQYHIAKDLLQQFYHSTSTTIIFSHPQQADDAKLKPSLLLAEFSGKTTQQELSLLDEGLHPYTQQLFFNNKQDSPLEIISEDLNIALSDQTISTGGTALIADQADCPFRSFAKHRLKASELPKLSYGLPAFAVGNMLHFAMEKFWQALKDQSSIDKLDEQQLNTLIKESASAGVKKIQQLYPQTMGSRYSELEIIRLSELLKRWLEQERKRGFFTVIEHEYALQWQYSTLSLNFRIDRVEQFDNGSFGLVDYKTSKNNSINWFEERLNKPQLMLYLLAAEKNTHFKKISSLLYAQVNIEEMKYRGISENTEIYPGVSLDKQRNKPQDITWEQLKQNWQASLENIAQEFLDGYLAIDPKSTTSCQYCHLDSFCRIEQQRQVQ